MKFKSDALAYLASPYTDPDPAVRLARYEQAKRAQVWLMDEGWMTYSPIAACHYFTAEGHNEGTWEWWARYDQRMIRACDLLIVLTIEGWERSRGVAAEREYAESLGMPVWGLLPHHAGGYRLDRRAEWAGEARVAGHRTCGNCGLYSCDGKCGKLNMFSCDLKK